MEGKGVSLPRGVAGEGERSSGSTQSTETVDEGAAIPP